jgi:hypothetical protein
VVAAVTLTSEQVRAYRILTSGLARTATTAARLPVWDLGLQDRDGSVRLAIAARLPDPEAVPDLDEPSGHGRFTLAWSLRGSPHLHRRGDLPRFAAALWPSSGADAAARLSGDAARLRSDGAEPMDAYERVSDAMRSVITEPMVKGEASAALTRALPKQYSGLCPGCRTVHVRELLFRSVALPASIGLVPDTKPVVLAPLSKSFDRPTTQHGLADLAAEFYRLFGVGMSAAVAAHLGTSAGGVKSALPADLVPVTVDGSRSQARESAVQAIEDADVSEAARIVRLLPPSDPLLQPRDRYVLTAVRAQQKALWPAIGSPGAVLAGGGLAGLWRQRFAGRSLTITITPWRELTTAERAELQDEAQIVGTARGAQRTSLVLA